MQPRSGILIIFFLLCSFLLFAQNKNPYRSLYKKAKTLTLTKGQYDEFFDQDSIQQIGTALVNVNTMQVVKLLKDDEAKKLLDNSTAGRFLSVDPLQIKYPYYSPYHFAGNSPIANIDLDGREDFYYMYTIVQKDGRSIATWNKIHQEPNFVPTIKGYFLKPQGPIKNDGWWDGSWLQFDSYEEMVNTAKALNRGLNFQKALEAQKEQGRENLMKMVAIQIATHQPEPIPVEESAKPIEEEAAPAKSEEPVANANKQTQAIHGGEVEATRANTAKERVQQPVQQAQARAKGLSPAEINFSQRTVSGNVEQYVSDMKAGNWDWNKSGPIRIMEMNGKWVTYDNRRLMAAQQAGLSNIPYRIVQPNDIMPGSKKTWAQAFQDRFNDPRNVQAGGAVPDGGLSSQPTVIK